jgi:HEAT repeat protein
VVNALEEGNRYAKQQAIKFAERCGDSESTQHLIRLSQSDELWDGHRVIQGDAAMALAARGCWEPVVGYYVHWGLEAIDGVNDFRGESGTLTVQDLAPALNVIRARGELTPGPVLAVGFAGWKQWSADIRSTLLSSPSDSELALSCAAALTWLEDHDPGVVPALKRLLDLNRAIALDALFTNGSDPARAVLTDELRRQFDPILAAHLLRMSSGAAEVISIVRSYLLILQPHARADALGDLVGRVDAAVLADCVNHSELDDFVRESAFIAQGPFRSVGASAVAVRVLSLKDPRASFLAAEVAFRDIEGPDRKQWPYLLTELDEQRSVAVLLNQAVSETKTRVVRAIGRALATPAGSEAVRKWLVDSDPNKRLTACRLAGWMGPDAALSGLVRQCLDDPDSQVVSEAIVATEQLALAELTCNLIDAFRRETDLAHRWAILDGLLAISDPGDAGRPRPWWAEVLGPSLPLAMRKYITDELMKSRDRAAREADDKDR